MAKSRDKLPQAATTDPGVAAWSALLRAHAALVPLIAQEVEAASGLPLSWYDVLLELNGGVDRRLRMQELSSRVVLSRTRVSRLVEEMARAGLVEKVPDAQDRRGAYAVMTARGRQQLHAAAPAYMAAIARQFTKHLTAGELAAIRRGLEKAIAAADS